MTLIHFPGIFVSFIKKKLWEIDPDMDTRISESVEECNFAQLIALLDFYAVGETSLRSFIAH
jgi:hypothetical protein